MRRWIKIAMIATIGLALIAMWILSASFENNSAVRINIPLNATKNNVKDSLTSRLGDVYGSMVYRLWSLASGDPLKAHGSYLIEPGTSAIKAAHRIAEGRQTPVSVTLNNMRTLKDLSKRLGAKLEANPEDFEQAIGVVLSQNKNFKKSEEYAAAFMPDTYEFYWTDAPEKVISKLANEYDSFWNNDRIAKADALGLTPVEVSTVASIVEEESNKTDERPKIARLYLNRIDKGMRLQADPTVKFAVGDFSLRRITGKHLKVESPYNTYRNAGLPPGPIRIPEKATLDAVLNAPHHNYLYMCAKSDFSGYHDFAADYATHQANAKKYQEQLNRRGIHK